MTQGIEIYVDYEWVFVVAESRAMAEALHAASAGRWPTRRAARLEDGRVIRVQATA